MLSATNAAVDDYGTKTNAMTILSVAKKNVGACCHTLLCADFV